MATYSEVEDLMIGDLIVDDVDIKMKYILSAQREIDAVVGRTYETPLVLSELSDSSVATIQLVSTKIASARLIMSLAVPGEDNRPNAYGRYLLREAMETLDAIAAKNLPLEGATLREGQNGGVPSVTVRDEESPVEAFENGFMRGDTVGWSWRPGAI